MGSDFEAARNDVRRLYQKVQVLRPPATRKNSVEVFLVGMDKKPSLA
jgi:23S rRNA U2552 (ribose-2'-O)-methylase RlmE/FtsJ